MIWQAKEEYLMGILEIRSSTHPTECSSTIVECMSRDRDIRLRKWFPLSLMVGDGEKVFGGHGYSR